VAAPIDAAVSANILSNDSQATAIAQQDAIINQSITGTAQATSDQVSDINQGSVEPPDTDTASTDDPAPAPSTTTSLADGQTPSTDGATTDPGTAPSTDAATAPSTDAIAEPSTEQSTETAPK